MLRRGEVQQPPYRHRRVPQRRGSYKIAACPSSSDLWDNLSSSATIHDVGARGEGVTLVILGPVFVGQVPIPPELRDRNPTTCCRPSPHRFALRRRPAHGLVSQPQNVRQPRINAKRNEFLRITLTLDQGVFDHCSSPRIAGDELTMPLFDALRPEDEILPPRHRQFMAARAWSKAPPTLAFAVTTPLYPALITSKPQSRINSALTITSIHSRVRSRSCCSKNYPRSPLARTCALALSSFIAYPPGSRNPNSLRCFMLPP